MPTQNEVIASIRQLSLQTQTFLTDAEKLRNSMLSTATLWSPELNPEQLALLELVKADVNRKLDGGLAEFDQKLEQLIQKLEQLDENHEISYGQQIKDVN